MFKQGGAEKSKLEQHKGVQVRFSSSLLCFAYINQANKISDLGIVDKPWHGWHHGKEGGKLAGKGRPKQQGRPEPY
jgi:hypothetical protein